MKRLIFTIAIILWAASAHAAVWYVDNTATGSNNGTSWSNAWTAVRSISWSSVSPGDTIYISGGSTSQTYNEALGTPKSGNVGNPITISIGQDSGHNGTAIFTMATYWLSGSFSNVNITGNYGGANHFRVASSNSSYVWYSSGSGVTLANIVLSYVDFPNMYSGVHISNLTWPNNIEISHCMFQKLDTGIGGPDDVIYGLEGSNYNTCAYGRHKIHDCTFYIPASGAYGDDGIKWGCGIDFYNNYVKVVIGSYSNTQHADVMQLNESYYRIYNNTFEDVGESLVYLSSWDGPKTLTGLLFYNNLVVNSHTPASDVARALDFLSEDAGLGGTYFTDIIVANNTFVDWTKGVFVIRESAANSYTNCYIKNNIFKNTSIATITADGGVSSSNNTSGNVLFSSYSQYAVSTNNFHLSSSDTVAIDHGTTLSSPIPAIDKAGVSRPQGAAWDIGAYEGSGGVRPMPPTLH